MKVSGVGEGEGGGGGKRKKGRPTKQGGEGGGGQLLKCLQDCVSLVERGK